MPFKAENPNRIFMVGPMGVGKTTIGRMLAKDLQLEFVDCDVEIEDRCGASIAWIFDMEGEAGFRERESQVLGELTKRENILLATGGGAILKKQNRDFLRERGIVVYLDASVEMLVKRTAKDKKRPLLQNANPESVLRRIKILRDPLYMEVADIQVFVRDNSSRKTVNRILHQLKSEGILE